MSADIRTLDELYAAFDGLSMEGGWHRRKPALWREPAKTMQPAIWRYADVRPVLEAAGELVSTEQAERRNLTMTNPAPGNIYPTVRTIVAAYQLMKPGETARSHRHTPNALRLVLTGTGTYTVVDGVRVAMEPGDVMLTPNWSWHAHGTAGTETCIWLDFLDVPLVHLLEPMFFEPHPQQFETDIVDAAVAPIAFRWADTLRGLSGATGDDGCERQIELGSPALRTIALFMQRHRPGGAARNFRTTANSLFAVAQGSGRTIVDGASFDWKFGDVVAVPAWRPYRHEAAEESVLLRVTDTPVMRALGFLREQWLD